MEKLDVKWCGSEKTVRGDEKQWVPNCFIDHPSATPPNGPNRPPANLACDRSSRGAIKNPPKIFQTRCTAAAGKTAKNSDSRARREHSHLDQVPGCEQKTKIDGHTVKTDLLKLAHQADQENAQKRV